MNTPELASKEELWQVLLELSVAAANRSPEAVSHMLGVVANLAQTAGQVDEASRLRQLAQNMALPSAAIPGFLTVFRAPRTFDRLVLPAEVRAKVDRFLSHRRSADVLRKHGCAVPNKILLGGGLGCGKTTLAHAIAAELEIPVYQVSGQPGANLVDLYYMALAWIRERSRPCMLLVDDHHDLFFTTVQQSTKLLPDDVVLVVVCPQYPACPSSWVNLFDLFILTHMRWTPENVRDAVRFMCAEDVDAEACQHLFERTETLAGLNKLVVDAKRQAVLTQRPFKAVLDEMLLR